MKTLSVVILTAVALLAADPNIPRRPVLERVQAADATVAPLVGTWEGTLQADGGSYRARLNITKDEAGTINVTVDSIDQNQMGLPASNVSLKGSTFHFELRSHEGVYEGTVDEMKTLIKGTWSQRGDAGLPLDFKKVQ
jgi:hypothetical protein